MNTLSEPWQSDEDYLLKWAESNHRVITEDQIDEFCELVFDFRNVMSDQLARDTAIFTIFH